MKGKKNKRRSFLNRLAVRLCMGIVVIGCILIGETCTLLAKEQTVELILNEKDDIDNAAFSVGNMFPGDVVERKYCVKVSYEDTVTVCFRVEIGDEYEKLAEVLKCRIVLCNTGELLHDGLMTDVPKAVEYALPYVEKGQEELIYQIAAYLDTSVGNEYQNTALKADFVWWVEKNTDTGTQDEETTGADTEAQEDVTIPDVSDPEEDIQTPDSGDGADVVRWSAMTFSAAVVFSRFAMIRKNKEGRDEQNA